MALGGAPLTSAREREPGAETLRALRRTPTAKETQPARFSLVITYDDDGDGDINKTETIAAIRDYFNGGITKTQAIRDAEIDGATSSTYALQAADNGKVIKVRVTFTDDAGNGESLTSEGTATVTMGGL